MKALICTGLLAITALTTQTSQAVMASVTPTTDSTYAKTRYPLVFVPGMFGFTRLGTAGFGMDYFYQVLPDLAKNGATAFVTQISPLNTTEIRGEQVLAQVEEVRAITGQDKVNLIGHSHGGPTARYVAAVHPEYVASVTGVGGTFYGSKVADDILAKPVIGSVIYNVIDNVLLPIMNWATNNTTLPNSMEASLQSISEAGSQKFNQTYPTAALGATCQEQGATVDRGVRYYSWSGRAQSTNALDVIDSVISQLAPLSYKSNDNDGLVATCHTHIGQVIRDDYLHSHLDEVNLLLGLRNAMAPDPVAIYRQHANRLKLQGL